MAVITIMNGNRLLASAQTKSKILCLHGGRGNADSMKFLVRDIENALPEYEFVYANGAHDSGKGGYLWIKDPPGGKGEPTTDPGWADESIQVLNTIVEEQGPFYGILGYSQGAAFVPVYLSRVNDGTFQIAITFCGYLTTTHVGLLGVVEERSPYGEIPHLVWMGERDGVILNSMTREMADEFTDPEIIVSESGGHIVPGQNDPTFGQVVAWMVDHSTTDGDDDSPSSSPDMSDNVDSNSPSSEPNDDSPSSSPEVSDDGDNDSPSLSPSPSSVTVEIPNYGCFGGDALVERVDGTKARMEDLSIGDFVLTGDDGAHEAVTSFGHHQPIADVEMVQIRTKSTTLELTHDHLLLLLLDNNQEYVPASVVQIGNVLSSGEAVISKENVQRRGAGLYAPFTSSGTIVVNGVVCSSYVTLQNSTYLQIGSWESPFSWHWLGHTYEKSWQHFIPGTSKNVTYTEDGIVVHGAIALKIANWIFTENVFFVQIPVLFVVLFLLILVSCLTTPIGSFATALFMCSILAFTFSRRFGGHACKL